MRILLVEDEPSAAKILAKGLRERGYAVDVSGDGADVGYKASVNEYDLVILDVMLPRKDGFKVCNELRANGAEMPILMLTARDAIEVAGIAAQFEHGEKRADGMLNTTAINAGAATRTPMSQSGAPSRTANKLLYVLMMAPNIPANKISAYR